MLHRCLRILQCAIAAVTVLSTLATAPWAMAAERQLKVALVLGAQVDDKAFNALAVEGFRRAERDFGVSGELILLDESPNPAAAMTFVLKAGYDLIITEDVGAMSCNLPWLLTQFPGQRVAHLDGDMPGPGVLQLRFSSEETAFLAGAAAALVSREKGSLPGVRGTHVVGFVGGSPSASAYLKAFEAGARHVDDKVRVLSSFAGTFVNPKAGEGLARLQYLQGADVVAHAAGFTGLGVLRAAAANRFYAIGADAEQDGIYPGAVLTSMVKRLDRAVYEAVRRLHEGTFAEGVVRYNLANGGVGITDMAVIRGIHGASVEKIAARTRALAVQLREGTVQVPRPTAAAPVVAATPAAPDIMHEFKVLLLQQDMNTTTHRQFASLAVLRDMGLPMDEKWDVPAMQLRCKDTRQLALLAGMYQADLQMDLIWSTPLRYKALLRLAEAVDEPLLKAYAEGLVALAKDVRDNGMPLAAAGGRGTPSDVAGDNAPDKIFLRYCGDYYRQWYATGVSLKGLPSFMDVWCGLFLQDAYVTLNMVLEKGDFSVAPATLVSISERLLSLSWMLDRIWLQPDLRRRVGAVWFRTVLQPLVQFMHEKKGTAYTADDVRYMLALLTDVRTEVIAPCQ